MALVHLGSDEKAAALFEKYGLGDTARVSDPTKSLYEAFGLKRARPSQILGAGVFIRGARAMAAGHRQTGIKEDGYQMPGVFLVRNGEIVREFRHELISDGPDYIALARGP